MKVITLAIAVCASQVVMGQDTGSFAISFNHVALSVKDVDRSAEFYANVLNLAEIVNRAKTEGIRWFSLGDGKELHLISTVSGQISLNKAVHMALSTPDFDRFMERIRSMEIPYSDWPGTASTISVRADGIRQIFLQDPDGYWIEVNSVGEK